MTEQEATRESQRDNLPMKGYRAESERIRCHRAALISNWRKQGSIRRKEEASYIGRRGSRETRHWYNRAMQQEKAFIPSSWPEQQNHIFTGTRSEERTRRSGRRIQTRSSGREGRGVAGRRGTYNWEEPFYLLYSLDVVHFYTDQKFKLDIDKSKKCNQK